MFEKQESGPLYTMILWGIVAGCAYAVFLLIRWLVVTREGNITMFSVLGFLVVFRIVGELVGGPSTPHAQASPTPAYGSSASVQQVPMQGWTRTIQNGQICVSYQGRFLGCDPINYTR